MKIAIISDIHSNLEALQSCLAVAEENGVMQYVCLGDCIGYGPDPVAVMETLLALPNFSCIVGNHEEYLFVEDPVEAKQNVKYAKDWTLQQLSERQMNFFSSIFYEKVENAATYVHATTDDDAGWVYINNKYHALNCMNHAKTNLVFYGHVHMPMVFHETEDKSINMLTPNANDVISLHEDQRYVINVGSVGQPRDKNPDASFVIYDDEANSVTFYRVAYEYAITAAKIRKYGLPEDFAHRVEHGQSIQRKNSSL